MVRKSSNSRTSASAAAAAAANPSTPAFTSFAAATAQALGAPSSTPISHLPSPWDKQALALLKKLSKRDSNTKLRALADLNSHICSLTTLDPGIGSQFVTAWSPTFRAALLDEESAAVRASMLEVMALVVATFRRVVQHVLPEVLPVWIAARGDLSGNVSDAAVDTLTRVLTTRVQREKVVQRYGDELRKFCFDLIATLVAGVERDFFLREAGRVVAVLRWLVEADASCEVVKNVIDAKGNPLMLLAKGPKRKGGKDTVGNVGALKEVCEFCNAVLEFMKVGDTTDVERAKGFSQIALLAIRKGENLGWDLALVLLRDGWCQAIQFEKLGDTIADAVTATFPTGLRALLPIFDALPAGLEESSVLAERVLKRMKNVLYPQVKDGEKKGKSNVGYVFAALPAYIECTSFVYGSGAKRWLQGQRVVQHDEYCKRIIEDHIIPITALYLSAEILPVPKVQNYTALNAQRKSHGGENTRLSYDFAGVLAGALQLITRGQWKVSVQHLAQTFLESYANSLNEEILRRYELVLDNLKDGFFETMFVAAVAWKVVGPSSDWSLDVGLAPLALSLSKPASCSIMLRHAEKMSGSDFVGTLFIYMKGVTSRFNEKRDRKDADDTMRGIAEVYSWIHWVSSNKRFEDVQYDVVDDIDRMFDGGQRWHILGEILRAHKRRKEADGVTPGGVICSDRLTQLVLEAAESLLGENDNAHAYRLIAEAIDLEGGAEMPLQVLRKITEVLTKKIMVNESDAGCDTLILVLLKYPVKYFETDDVFRNLVTWTILRAAVNDDILSEMISVVEGLPSDEAFDLVKDMMKVIRERECSSEGDTEVQRGRRARVTARIISTVQNDNCVKCVALCASVLSWSSNDFTAELLGNVPLSSVFGDGINSEFRHDGFLDVFEAVSITQEHEDVSSLLQNFMVSLNAEDIGRVARLASKRFLTGSYGALSEVLTVVCRERRTEEHMPAVVYELIVDVIAEAINNKGTSTVHGFDEVPHLVQILVAKSRGDCLEALQSIVKDAVKIIRNDPLSARSGTALHLISASLWEDNTSALSDSKNPVSRSQRHPSWLEESTFLALTAARRCLERPLPAAAVQLHNLETHSSFLFGHAIKVLGQGSIGEADIRFWALRTKDVLVSFMGKRIEGEESVVKAKSRRLSSLTLLGSALIEYDESVKLLQPVLVQEICHFGAWATVSLLPAVNTAVSGRREGPISVKGTCDLVLKAAERGVLVSPDGGIPVDAELVYPLVPFLASHDSWSRKAVLTLLVFTATIELPTTVSKAFPKNGFGDEAKKIAFVTRLVPKPLRDALEWPVSTRFEENNEDAKSKGYITAEREVGYFLAWRLFLDLIRSDDSPTGSISLGDAGEDMSFRRVGTTYLRSNPELYSMFFNKCVEVVVDGNPYERAAAGAAAVEALEAEERGAVAQGAQLVKEQIEKEEKVKASAAPTSEDDSATGLKKETVDSIDEEVGHAAGISFARALQRLPALSRQHVTDKLDRGTALRVEAFVRRKISPLLIAAEIRKVKEWGAFGGGPSGGSGSAAAGNSGGDMDGEGELHARGSVAGRLVWATYTFSDVTLEIGIRLPEVFPLQIVEVEARSGVGMSESRWRKTLLGMTTLLRAKDGTLAEAVELWRRNLDKTFQGAEECPICYSVLHLVAAALPKMQCRTCKNLFHSECLCKWFTKSNSSACPLCRSAF